MAVHAIRHGGRGGGHRVGVHVRAVERGTARRVERAGVLHLGLHVRAGSWRQAGLRVRE